MRRKPRAAPSKPDGSSWVVFLTLLIVTVLAYAPAWHGGLLWDDDAHVTKSALQSIDGLWRIWFDVGATQQYYPVLHSAFWILHRVFGSHTLGYHLLNAGLHALSAYLFVAVLRRLHVPGAVLAGAIFALHPVHVESVAWITELKNTLSGVWYLLAALVYLRFDNERRPAQYGIALGLFATALLTKSVTATLPAALLVVFWWRRGALKWREDVVPLAPFFVLGIGAGLGTIWVEREYIGAFGPAFDFTFVERALIAGRAVVFYATTLVWPENLAFVYPRWNVNQSIWWQYLYLLGVLATLTWCWSVKSRTRAPLAVALLYTGTLFPALGFFNVYPFIFSFVADHFQYLATLSLVAAAAAGLTRAASRWLSHVRWAVPALLITIGGVLGALTWQQSRQYVSAEVLYEATIERNPDAWMAHLNLGWLRLQRGQADAALRDTQHALRLEPNLPQGHNNLGTALRSLGRMQEAELEYRESLRLKPGAADTRYNLGLTLIDLGRPAEAEPHIAAYLALHPDDAAAHGQRGDALQSMGRFVEAITAYRTSIQINPRDARVRANFGSALGREGRLKEAIAEFTEALRLDPSHTQARQNLELARSRLGGGV